MTQSLLDGRFADALMRAKAAIPHVASGTLTTPREALRCNRCDRAMPEWDKPCDCFQAVLGRDFLGLIEAAKRYEDALREIVAVLGPEPLRDCPGNKCEGCQFEMAEALRVAKAAMAA